MVIKIVIVALILIYSIWVVRRRIRQVKNGQYCDCCGDGSCSGCGRGKKQIRKNLTKD